LQGLGETRHNFTPKSLLAIFRTEDAKNMLNSFPTQTICCLIRLRHLCGDLLLDHLWKREKLKGTETINTQNTKSASFLKRQTRQFIVVTQREFAQLRFAEMFEILRMKKTLENTTKQDK